ncbi:hypothetical protein TWF281_001628 [Arthrobotrys megalospora]
MANLNDDFQEILDTDGSLDPIVDFSLGVRDQPRIVDGAGADFFEDWVPGLPQLGMDSAILLPGISDLQTLYDEQDAPHDLDNESGFVSPSMLFTQLPSQQYLPASPTHQFHEHEQFYTEPFVGQYPLGLNPTRETLMIDPQLENSGSSEYDNYQNLLGTPDENAFILPSAEEDYGIVDLPPAAPIAPMGQLVSAEHHIPPISLTSPTKKGRIVLGTNQNANNMKYLNSEIVESGGKGKAPVTGGRARNRSMSRAPLTRTSGNSAGSDLDDDIDLEKIIGISRGSLSMPQSFTQSVGFLGETGMETHIEDSHFDSDETIDLEEYAAACHADISSIGEYLANVTLPRPEHEREASTEVPLDVLNGDSSLLQSAGEESPSGTASPATVPAKRGRGRPIVPGSKRQRRIHAMAQPDYVPPKRGRPRTSERGQRKRVRRAKTIQQNSQPVLPPRPEFASQLVAQPTPDSSQEGFDLEDPSSFNLIYKPVILNNEIGYTPDQFILEPMQAQKIQQIYNVELPPGGWSETIDRWRLTFNLNRITPPSSFLYKELNDLVGKYPTQFQAIDAGNKENVEPMDEDIAESQTSHVQLLLHKPTTGIEVEIAAQESVFPDQRLKIVTGNGIHHEMTHEQVLEKLLDERDVYFRAIVWELIQGAQHIGSMEFVGSWNRMSGVWEFV